MSTEQQAAVERLRDFLAQHKLTNSSDKITAYAYDKYAPLFASDLHVMIDAAQVPASPVGQAAQAAHDVAAHSRAKRQAKESLMWDVSTIGEKRPMLDAPMAAMSDDELRTLVLAAEVLAQRARATLLHRSTARAEEGADQ